MQTVSFAVTAVLVASTTYLFSGMMIWTTRQPSRLQILKRAFKIENIVAFIMLIRRRMMEGLRGN